MLSKVSFRAEDNGIAKFSVLEIFVAEARRVASELVVVASIRGVGDSSERWDERRLRDGSRWTVYKRVFEGADLAHELGGEVVFRGRWFVVVRA